ncbi:MAG: glucose-1-phosphate adenylyltransferase [Chitinophagales bacterium]|nr:glucose-1-phosphate adenylyltransferase [Chitinophagales bacterium]MDW8393276.1 glucose-1-phosphate adenylyltransferase [Chitinophagales bacterium]
MGPERVIAVIMGGGAGTRLHPLTLYRAKPAVPIAGKYRLVDIPVSNCINSNIQRMFVLTQFNSASLNKHIKNTYHFSIFSKAFVDILAAEQTPSNRSWFQGTADAVRQSLHHIYDHAFDYVLILSGDQLYQMNFQHLLEAHESKEADVTIATIPVREEEAPEFGILKTGSDGFIEAFVEKPSPELLPHWSSEVSEEMKRAGRTYLASMGIYVFSRKVLYETLTTLLQATDFGKEIIPLSVGKLRMYSFAHETYWSDIGNIRSFYESNLSLTDEVPAFNLFDSQNPVYTHPRNLPPAKISGTAIHSCILAEGSIILADRLERCVIGTRSRIGKGTRIYNSYVMGNDYYQSLESLAESHTLGIPAMGIGNNCYIKNAIIDKNCFIGNDVHIEAGPHLPDQETQSYVIRNGIAVIKKGAVIPHKFKLQ